MGKYRLVIEMDEVLVESRTRHLMPPDGNELVEKASPSIVNGFSAQKLPRAGSEVAIMMISRRYDVIIVSAEAIRNPSTVPVRMAWLNRNFSELKFLHYECNRDIKSLSPDVYLSNRVGSFDRLQGLGILFSTPDNLDDDWPCRIESWGHASGYLMDIALCLDFL